MSRITSLCPNTRQHGFTLIEMIVFIVIVSVALAGVLSVLNITTARSADPIQPKQAMLIAESMLEEILLKPYNNPTTGGYPAACPGTCDRAQFDNTADYADYRSTGIYSLDDLTTRVSGLDSYNVRVSIGPETTIQGATGRLVTVTVEVGTGGPTYSLTSYRFNYD